MGQATTSQDLNDNDVDIFAPVGAASLESILCTEQLTRRPPRPPDFEKENGALLALSIALTDSPRTVLQTLADTILEVCQSGSSGVSLLTTEDNGKRFYWPAIAGEWQPHIGGGTPRNFGPCGDVLDRNTPLLFHRVERRYTYFAPVTPPVEEALLVPFYVESKAVGTIWAVAHDNRRKFDAEDKRVMISLGKFASSAYQILISLNATTAFSPRSQEHYSNNNSDSRPELPLGSKVTPGLCVKPPELSVRQLTIASFVAEGYSNREIAKELKLTEQVVKNVVYSLFNLLGVWNRVELANYFSSDANKAGRGRIERDHRA
jgi:DNA-binding CsgD family transcriptional regulator